MKTDKDDILRITKNVELSMETNWNNIERYRTSREFVFKSTLSTKAKNSLSALNIPILEFNLSEAFLSRLRGEFAEQQPGIMVSIQDGVNVTPEIEQQRELIEGYVRFVMDEASRNGTQTSLWDEITSGGFSAAKVYAKYDEGKTFKQKIVWAKSYDPTLTGFDPLSREPSKSDSEYCFELFPYSKEKFEKMFDHKIKDVVFSNQEKFSWFFKIHDMEVVVVADYYEKQQKKIKIVELSTGEVIEKKQYATLIEEKILNSLEAAPVIINEREVDTTKIIRYQLIGNTILSKEEIDTSDSLPLVWFDGSSVVLSDGGSKSEQMTRPYLMNCIGVQKLFNNLGAALADECQNLSRHKILIASESIDPNYVHHITEPQQYDTLVYRAFNNNNPDKPNPPPQQMARNAFPPEMLALWSSLPQVFQNILGSYDSQLGINGGNNLSGAAIVQGAIHSSATAKPFINRYILSLNQVAKIILGLIPKVYVAPMSIPMIDKEGNQQYHPVNGEGQPSLKYEDNTFNIKVEAGTSFIAQKTQALQQIIQLSQASQVFSQFINTKGLKVLIDNIDMKGQDQLKLLAAQFMQELEQQKQQAMQAQQNPQPNPIMMREKNHQDEIQMKGQQNQIEAQKYEMQAKLEEAKLNLAQEELALKRVELIAKTQTEEGYMALQQEKNDADMARVIIDKAHAATDMNHRHAKDHAEHGLKQHELMHKISTGHRPTGEPHFTNE